MTLLTICTAAADEIGIEAPTAIIGNDETTARRLKAFASRTGVQVMRAYDWPILQKEHEITTVASQAEYALPSDFDRFIDETAWDRTNYWKMRGSLSPQEWQIWKSGLVATSTARRRIRLKAGTSGNAGSKVVVVDPTPSSVDTLVIEYVSNGWVSDTSASTYVSDWTADDDTTLLDEDLLEMGVVWRLLRRLGQDYAEEFNEFTRSLEERAGHAAPREVADMASGPRHIIEPNIPETIDT